MESGRSGESPVERYSDGSFRIPGFVPACHLCGAFILLPVIQLLQTTVTCRIESSFLYGAKSRR
jgi:hypothetical protein